MEFPRLTEPHLNWGGLFTVYLPLNSKFSTLADGEGQSASSFAIWDLNIVFRVGQKDET